MISKIKNENTDSLFKAVLSLKTIDECYAFFDEARQVFINTEKKEYLVVRNFYTVFEAIIDELVGDNPLPDGMDKVQEDGKIVDHLYTPQPTT